MLNPNLDPNSERLTPTEKEIERVLRPQEFEDFTGQEKSLKTFAFSLKQPKIAGKH